MPEGTGDWARIAAEAARTVPGRENGGNCDIKNLSNGCKVYFPVFVEGEEGVVRGGCSKGAPTRI